MTEYVIIKCEPEIQEMEVWFPIAMTYVESEFDIGKVRIATLRREMFDSWRDSQAAGDDELKAAMDKVLDRMLKDFQGLAATVTKVVAEPTRAKEIAVEDSEKALAMLRFFSPANFFPRNGFILYSAWQRAFRDTILHCHAEESRPNIPEAVC